MKNQGKYRIKVLEKALSILELFDEKGKEFTVTEISGGLGLNKPSTFRILSNLEDAGYLDKDPKTARYSLGPKLYHLGSLAEPHARIRKVARPFLKKLNEQCHETVHLAVLDYGEALYVGKIEGKRTIRVITRVGARLPAHCSGVGKVLLSALSEDSLVNTLSEKGLSRFTENTITDFDLLKQELATCKGRGYAIDNEEIEEGLKCVAAPVYENGKIVAAISISAHSERFNKETPRYVSLVKKAAKGISDALSQY